MFFKRKEENGVITTRVTQTGASVRFEEMVRDTAIEQNRKCPECGYINEPRFVCLRRGDGKKLSIGNCEKCKAKWETVY